MRLLSTLIAVIAVTSTFAAEPDKDGFVSLFNGKDLTGWVPVNVHPKSFFVKDGEIVVGIPQCFGDGSGAACPCGNSGTTAHGCQNSAGTGGALLTATGTTVPDTVVLHSTGELPSSRSIFLQGNATIPPAVYGDGLRCAGGILKRLYKGNASGGAISRPGMGDPSITARSAALGDPIPPGERRYYQVYFRDANPNFCAAPIGNTFNISNAVKVTW